MAVIRHIAALGATVVLLAACGPGANDDVASVALVGDAASAATTASTTIETVAASTTTPPAPATTTVETAEDRSALGTNVYDLEGCPDAPRGAVADKANQRYWLCMDGQAVTDRLPMTTASSNYGLPPVGTYEVFARDANAFGIDGEPLERFVAFYTTPRGNRIAFHEVVDQDPATVGDLDQRGASAGCFRLREPDSIQVWEFLQLGDPVVVVSN